MSNPEAKSRVDTNQEQITPAAQELLEEYVSLYRARVINEAQRLVTLNSGRTIRLADVRSAEEIASRSRVQTQVKPLPWRLPTIAALLLIVNSTAVAVSINLLSSGDNTTGWGAVLVSGISLVALMSGFYAAIARSNRPLANIKTQDLLIDVADLERQARETASNVIGADFNGISLSRVISVLEEQGIWSPSAVASFRGAMKLRNQVAYEERTNFDSDELLTASRTIRQLGESLADFQSARSTQSTNHTRSPAENLELEVYRTLEQTLTLPLNRSNERFADILVESPNASVGILVKYRHGRPIRLKDIEEWLQFESGSLDRSTVVVTNADLDKELLDVGSIQLEAGRSVRVVKWEGPRSAPALARAVARALENETEVIKSTHGATSTGSGRFEIYTDATGKFRFRLKAANGLIVAVGEAFESKSGAMTAIENVQRSSAAAVIKDATT